MATVKSTTVTAYEAGGQIATENAPGKVTRAVAVPTLSATQASGDDIQLFPISSSAIVDSLRIWAADATTAGAINIGIYSADGDGNYTAVDADFFASAIDLTGGPLVGTEVVHESGEYTLAESEMPLWEALGLSSDPGRTYFVGAAVSTTFIGGPTAIKFVCDYRQ